MKLRNKDTGEIAEIPDDLSALWDVVQKSLPNSSVWEDYKEPKEYWCIDWAGGINHITVLDGADEYEEDKKAIGNYFETQEEVEKAVEKLKAWKRLKDKGFRFTAWYGGSKNISYEITSLENKTYIPRQICDDLDLLFGGEE